MSARTRREYDRRAQTAIWAGEIGTWIDRYVKLPSVNLLDVNIDEELNSDAIDQITTSLREFWGLGSGPVGNLVRLLESKGITVVKQTFESQKVDAFSRIVLGRPYVFLSHNKSSYVRSRFDAAHELGHLIMHQHITNSDLERSGVLSRIEREANLFAASFLMPASSFPRELYGTTLQSFINLKPRWKVSVQAMIMRASDLGVISDAQKSSLMTQIAAKGMRVIEPLDNELKAEEPMLFRKAWEVIVDNRVRPVTAISDDLALRPEFIAGVLHIPADRLVVETDISNIIPFTLKPQGGLSRDIDLSNLPTAS
ncbi:MAG: ImmA/IrrE family metallo-endopeptidase [Verrucomicrobiaceae bacterium]